MKNFVIEDAPRRCAWLVGLLMAPLAVTAWAAAPIPQSVLASVTAGQPQDFIVEFDDAEAEAEVQQRRATKGLSMRHVDAHAARQHSYHATKSAALAHVVPGHVQVTREFSNLPLAKVRFSDRAALQRLAADARVKAIHERRAYETNLQQSLPLINQPAMYATGFQGERATVAVLDTGVDYRTGWLKCTSVGVGKCAVVAAKDFAENDNQLDDNGHGTNVAAIVHGVAPRAGIAALDVFTYDYDRGNHVAYNDDIIEAIDWSIANRAKYNIVALNLSLGNSSENSRECGASWATTPFRLARAAGIIPVVAAGNSGSARGVSEPACAPGAVRVGAVYDDNVGPRAFGSCYDANTSIDQPACFSNAGRLLTLWAPGVDIDAGGHVFSGTSMAAPHVAGALAVLRGRNAFPSDTVEQSLVRLTKSSKWARDPRSGIVKPRLDLMYSLSAGKLSNVSLRTHSNPGRYVRIRDFRGYVEQIDRNSTAVRYDSTFAMVPSLAQERGCVSFVSSRYPRFLRVKNGIARIDVDDGSAQFKKDATFCRRQGLADRGKVSWENNGKSGLYLVERNAELRVEKRNGSPLFDAGATFSLMRGLKP